MVIRNINNLSAFFDTSRIHLESTLSTIANMDISVDNTPTQIRISHFVGECNTDLSGTFKFPFDSNAVTAFLDSLEPMVANMLDIYDDPLDMLMNTTNPGESWTIEDAGQCLSDAEANGWKFPDYVTPEFILDLYNDMEAEKGDE